MKTHTCRTGLVLSLALLTAATASSQTPIVDTAFTSVTPNPDIDLVIVRERAYGAGGVDLSAYVSGAGVEDYVQSVYVRVYKGVGGPRTAFQARITFPVGVQVLGLVTSAAPLGGSSDDGVLTESDALFAIDPLLADDYSAPDRGIDPGEEELACIVAPNVVFVTLGVTSGLDDVRILVDYGSSFPTDVSIDIESTAVTVPSDLNLAVGMQVGDPTGMSTAGSGDYGEVRALLGLPLIGSSIPSTGTGFTIDLTSTLFLARDLANTRVDAFDVNLGFPLLAVFRGSGSPGSPRALTIGPLGLIVSVGSDTGTAWYDYSTGATSSGSITPNLSGSLRSATGLQTTEEFLYVARDPSGDSFVDEVRACDMSVVRSFTIAQATLAAPVGLTDAGDGMLYLLGVNGELVRIDPVSGAFTLVATTGQGGNVEIGRDAPGGTLYLVRDMGTSTSLDVYDVASGLVQLDVLTWAERAPRDVTGGPFGHVYVVGNGGTNDPKKLYGIDPGTWTIVLETDCVDIQGGRYGLTPAAPTWSGRYCGPAVPNSTGLPATIRARGTGVAGDPLELSAWGLPANKFGYFLVGQGTGELFPVPGSQGRICLLGGAIGRFNTPAQIGNSGAIRRFCVEVDTSALPLTPVVGAQPGETWNFQCWFRDTPGTSSNFTEALEITFQ